MAKPKTIPIAPINRTQGLIAALDPISPVSTTLTIAAKGPIAFATSFDPCAKAIALADTTINIPKANSMPPSRIICSLLVLKKKAVASPTIELNIAINK